jgi:nucleoside-diphosphate-sugar epimerase
MKRVLITGATGFVGAHLARRLLREGHEVHALVRPGYTGWRIESIRADVRLHELDMDDDEALNARVAQIRPEWVFHLAVHGAYSSQTSLKQMVQTNIISTFNLVEACLKTGFEAFINTGSSSEYGFKDHAPDETEWVDPNSYYAVTKVSATQFCRHVAIQHDAHIVTLRLYSVYGPYEEPARLMPTLIRHGFKGELPPLVNPDIARDYVYTDDVDDAYLLAASTQVPRGAVYNVGTGVQTTLREVVDVARRTLNIPAEPQWGTMPDRKWDTSVWVSNPARIGRELGWQPRVSFADGFKRMADWLREHREYHAIYGLDQQPKQL